MKPLSQTAAHNIEASGDFVANRTVYEPELALPHGSAVINSIAILWRARRRLGKITIIGTLLTLLIVLLIPNTYESTVRLMGPDAHGGSEMAMLASVLGKADSAIGGISGMAANMLGGSSPGEVVMGVLRSRTVGENIVNKFDLKTVYWTRKGSDAREELAHRTSISEDRKTGIITITVADHDPQRATDMARAYVDQLNGLLNQVNTSAAHRQRVFIEERLQEVKQELADASTRLSDFSAKNTTLDPKEQGRAMVGAAVNLQGDLIAVQAELKGLQQMYSDSNVRVRSAKARLAELQRQLQDLHGSDVPETAPETGESLYPTFSKLPALGLTYANLYREIKLREAVFETLTEQYELARIEEAKEIPTVKVLDPADFPDKKSGPPRTMVTLFGLVMSFCLGSTWLVGRVLWGEMDHRDPRKRLAFDVLQDTRPIYSRWQQRWHRG